MEHGREEVMQDVKEYIDGNIEKVVSVDELADKFDMNTSEFYESFVKSFSVNPKKYISDKRMDQLVTILQETGDQEIVYYYAHVLGFKTAGGITNFVKRRTGLNFTEFRQRLLSEGKRRKMKGKDEG